MPDPKSNDDLSPAQKDAALGGRDRSAVAPSPKPDAPEEGHLGPGGDPAEGAPRED